MTATLIQSCHSNAPSSIRDPHERTSGAKAMSGTVWLSTIHGSRPSSATRKRAISTARARPTTTPISQPCAAIFNVNALASKTAESTVGDPLIEFTGSKRRPTISQLMRAYGVGWWRTFVTLRLPASVPFLLPALRLAAAAAVIGTVVAEVSIGLRGGIGRMVVEYAQSAGGDPAKAWAPIFGAVAVGLVAAGAVGLIGLALRPLKLTGASS